MMKNKCASFMIITMVPPELSTELIIYQTCKNKRLLLTDV